MAAAEKQGSQPGKIPKAPHIDTPAKPQPPAQGEGLGIDPQQRQGKVPTAPHLDGGKPSQR